MNELIPPFASTTRYLLVLAGYQPMSSYHDTILLLFISHHTAATCQENNLAELHHALIEEWDRLSLDDFEKYIKEMPQRCEAVILAGGGHTKW
jgi:hypothetical protein